MKSLEDYIKCAQDIATKRDAASYLEEREYFQYLLDASVQDIIYIQNHMPPRPE